MSEWEKATAGGNLHPRQARWLRAPRRLFLATQEVTTCCKAVRN